jgi:hypothetical protein
MAKHGGNLSTPEAEIGELQVQGQFGLHSKTLSQKKKSYINVLNT